MDEIRWKVTAMKAKAMSDRAREVIRTSASALTYRRGEIIQLNERHSGMFDEKEPGHLHFDFND